jgi:hypothetical protein
LAIQKPSHTFTKIHLKALRTNIFQILFALSFTVFINTFCYAQDIPNQPNIEVKPETPKDSVQLNLNVIAESISSEKIQDSTLQDTIKPKKEFLTDIVDYKATDYTSFNQSEQKLYLYNDALINYGDMEITAGYIIIDYSKNEVYAKVLFLNKVQMW